MGDDATPNSHPRAHTHTYTHTQNAVAEARTVQAKLLQLQAAQGIKAGASAGGSSIASARAGCPAGSYCPPAEGMVGGGRKAGRTQSLAELVQQLLPRNPQPVLPVS